MVQDGLHPSIPNYSKLKMLSNRFTQQTKKNFKNESLIVQDGSTFFLTFSVKKSFPVYMDDAEHLTIFGGSGIVPSFKGYIGKATVYRSRKLKPEQVRAFCITLITDLSFW